MGRARVGGLECLSLARLASANGGSTARAALVAALGQLDVHGTNRRASVPGTKILAKHP